jgi:membrane protease YdiL (CAAX protease family)
VILSVAKALVPSLNLEQKQELGFDMATTGKNLLPIFVSLVILPPVVEEIVTRGFLYTNLRSRVAIVPAAIITSILFAAAHLGEASDGLLWVAAIDTFVLSMVMCHLREKTGSLWPSMGVHFIKNGLAFFVLFNILGVIR